MARREYTLTRVQEVKPSKDEKPYAHRLWDVSFDKSMGAHFHDEFNTNVVPKVGDRITFWGTQGFAFRGVAVNDTVFFYRSETEDKKYHRELVNQRKLEQKREYDQKKAEYETRIAALPPIFRERIAGYFKRNPEFWEFLPYELFTCEEAVKIAEALRGEVLLGKQPLAAVKDFYDLPIEEQKARIPTLQLDQHSGNTFGSACMLARVYLEKPEYIPKMRGAMAPLVGSKEYGDYAASPEAALERRLHAYKLRWGTSMPDKGRN